LENHSGPDVTITDVVCVPIRAGFFTDDQAAIRAGAVHDGFGYAGVPLTVGFDRVRMPGAAVSVLLCLDHGQIAHGDCAAVQYATVGGRDAVFDPAEAVRAITERVAPLLVGQATTGFRKLADEVEALRVGGRLLHTAIRYGVSQALLDAVAKTHRVTMAEVIRDEYQTGVALRPVPVFAQSGDDRYDNVDKMILKGVDVLPHGLINSRRAKLGYGANCWPTTCGGYATGSSRCARTVTTSRCCTSTCTARSARRSRATPRGSRTIWPSWARSPTHSGCASSTRWTRAAGTARSRR
jgi:methylaspartate ammonia-lyase